MSIYQIRLESTSHRPLGYIGPEKCCGVVFSIKLPSGSGKQRRNCESIARNNKNRYRIYESEF